METGSILVAIALGFFGLILLVKVLRGGGG
jgi:hypothetical protein